MINVSEIGTKDLFYRGTDFRLLSYAVEIIRESNDEEL